MKQHAVLIDTSIWVDYFKGTQVAQEKILPLIQQGKVYICGVIVYEILAGVSNPQQRRELIYSLDSLTYLEADKETWEEAADLFHKLKRRGIILPLSDILVAILARRNQCCLLTRDTHFSYIENLPIVSLNVA